MNYIIYEALFTFIILNVHILPVFAAGD
jgi:hypothetical protein